MVVSGGEDRAAARATVPTGGKVHAYASSVDNVAVDAVFVTAGL